MNSGNVFLGKNKGALGILAIILIAILVAVSIVAVMFAVIILGFWNPFGTRIVGSGNLITR